MKRKKRKNNTIQQKQVEAAQFNFFKKQIVTCLKLMKCECIECILDNRVMHSLYRIRNNVYPKLRFANDVVVSGKLKRELQSAFDFHLSEAKIEIQLVDEKISLKSVFKYLSVIDCYMNDNQTNTDPNVMRLIKSYREKVPDFSLLLKDAYMSVHRIMGFIGLLVTRMSQSICWLESNIDKNLVQNGYNVVLHEHIPEKKLIKIDGHNRSAFPICLAFADKGPGFAAVAANDIYQDSTLNNLPIPVYFQNHLIHRLEERIDCINYSLLQIYLYKNFVNPKIIQFKGKILVEFEVAESIKIGYIIVEYIHGILLAKTFLLLTNSGTPEGEQLILNSGMQKVDLKYWEMDKLSTFQFSDIKDQPQIRNIFEKSGCGALFTKMTIVAQEKSENNILLAKQLLDYIEF